MGPTARLIEEKTPAELMRQTIAREIEAAFAADQFRPEPAAGDHLCSRRAPPGLNAIKPQIGSGDFRAFAVGRDIGD
jgi:hypothetical protein